MRKYLPLIAFLAASPIAVASAADMPLKAPRAPYAAGYSWTGLYIGGEFGGGWATQQTTVVTAPGAAPAFPAGTVLSSENLSGILGGGYAGYNYQMNNIVVGIDGFYDGADLTGSGRDVSVVNGDIATHSPRMDWLASVAGRIGYAQNNLLFFGRGGWAWAGFNSSTTTTTALGALASTTTASGTRDGWTLGAGIEYGFTPHWSAKLEYDYVRFDTANYSVTTTSAAGVVATPSRSTTSDLNIFKGGVAYRF